MIQTKTVDITPMKITLPVIEMSQYDLGREVVIHMKDGSDWFDLTGYTAKLQGTKPSGFGYTVDGVVDGHDITFASNYDMTSEAGFIPSEVRLTKGGVSLGSLNLILHVEKTPHDVTTTDGSPESLIPELTVLVNRAEAAVEVILDCSATATTLPAGSNATASYDVDNGVFTFGIPRGNKGETGDTGETGNGIASITKTGTSGLVDTYTITFTNGTTTTFTVTNGQNGTGAVADVWQNGVSVLDGTTAKVTVPTYDAVTDNEPYLFRQSGNGLDIHNREHDTLVGGTVAWNQLIDFTRRSTNNATASFDDTEHTFTVTASAQQGRVHFIFPTIKGHKYFTSVEIKTTTATVGISLRWYGAFPKSSISTTNWQTISNVISNTYDSESAWQLQIADGRESGWDAVQGKNPMCIDLTQMFGSTIADYIYSLEQGTAGSGVAFFKTLFPKPYYAYNAGELMSVSGVSAHNMSGFNQWDEEWEKGSISITNGSNENSNNTIRSKNFIKIIPNTTYRFTCTGNIGAIIFGYDANKNFVGRLSNQNATFVTGATWEYIRFRMYDPNYGGTYKNDICINLSWDGERDGEYEPYVLHSYPLDDSLTLRGIPKISNGSLYYDGDTYASDGTVTRKYGTFDLGTLNWNKESEGVFYANGTSKGINAPTATTSVATMLCGNGAVNKSVSNIQTSKDGIGAYKYGSNVYMYYGDTSVSSGADLKTKLTGVYLVYELATQTTETAEPYTNPQVVDEYGTEEYVSTSIVPVGHQTAYPDLFSGDYNDLVNKPTIPTETSQLTNDSDFVIDASYVHTDNNFTTTLKDKLDGIASGAEVNVQADWNEQSSASDAYIANKPTIPTVPAWAQAPSKPTYTASEVGAATADHVHGYITNSGDITASATIANGDRLVINDESASKVLNSSITFGTATNTYLRNNGTWGAPKTSTTASLTVAGWSSSTQTVTVTGVTTTNDVIVSPAPASYDAYVSAGIRCTAQTSNSLTFTCTTTPSEAITVNVLIIL